MGQASKSVKASTAGWKSAPRKIASESDVDFGESAAMRKVLLRFVFDNLWQWQAVDNELHIGVAWFMLLWVMIVGIAFGVMYSTVKETLLNLRCRQASG